jgi:hypothetical protein
MKVSQLKALIREEVRKTLNEAKVPDEGDAAKFIQDVLKLGSRQNLFDTFIKKEKIDPNELSTLIELVADRLKKKWA